MKLTVIKALGSGGFGNVDLVEKKSGERFARKTFSINQKLPDELIPNVRKRFIREAQLQSGITHRNIVPIVYTHLEGDAPWYLMPVADSTLERDIAHDKTIGGDFRIAISDIISGLEELHSMQMYHRDLKPQNVLKFIDHKTAKPYYAISDFGFVSLKDSRLSKLTYTGMAKGTDYYTAPEITKDLRSANARSDIYSLGCIIHDMVGVEDRVPCAEIRESGVFDALLLNCTRAKPDRRFKSVETVRDVFLSIDTSGVSVSTKEAGSLADILDSDDDLDRSQLNMLAEFLEDNEDSPDAIILLRKLSIDRIKSAWPIDYLLTKRIGLIFSAWVACGVFDFEYCDVLANRSIEFINEGDFDLQSECLLALLKMGTRHNRWYVERIFVNLCGADMDEGLAKRLSVEFRASGDEICSLIDRMEGSISATRNDLHPALIKALAETCD